MLLALDTASTTASVALYNRDTASIVGEMTWEGRRRQTQELMVMVRHLLALAGACPDDLTALAVTTGPGSFTGVRIAVSAAMGIGLGLATPPLVVGVPTLSVTAAPWTPLAATHQPSPRICAVMHAGRGRYHWTFFAAGATPHRPGAEEHFTGPAIDLANQLCAAHGARVWLLGELDAPLIAAAGALPDVTLIEPAYALRRAGALAHLAAQLIAAGEAETLASLQPLYLREP